MPVSSTSVKIGETFPLASNFTNHDALLTDEFIDDDGHELDLNAPVVILCYGLIVIVSLVGNLLVCKVTFSGRACGRNRRTHTTTDLLIGSLALSDLVMSIFNIPFNITRLLLPHWPFGSFMCYAVPFVQTACVYVSTFTMTAIALHRWRTVSPHSRQHAHHQLVPYRNRSIIVLTWLLAILLAIPTVAFNTLKEAKVNGQLVIRCRVHYPALPFSMSLFLTIEIFLSQYVIPLILTGVLYIKIAKVVTKQGRMHQNAPLTKGFSKDSEGSPMSCPAALFPINIDRKRQRNERKNRRIIMLALVVIVFAICWLPLNLYHLATDLQFYPHHLKTFLVCHWFAMSSVCYNSLIYILLNEHFRENAKQSLEYVLRCAKFYQQSNKKEIVGGQDNGTVFDGAATNHIAIISGLAGVTTSRIGTGAGYTNASVVLPCGAGLLAENLVEIQQFDSTIYTNDGDDKITGVGDVELESMAELTVTQLAIHVHSVNTVIERVDTKPPEPTNKSTNKFLNHYCVFKNLINV